MKLTKEQRKKILDIISSELDNIAEELIEREGYSIEDTIEADDVFERKDGIAIQYTAEGDVRLWEWSGSSDSPGEYGNKVTFDVHIDSIDWFEPDDAAVQYVCSEDLDRLNYSLKDLYYDNIRFC